jgi:hypothetical protein
LEGIAKFVFKQSTLDKFPWLFAPYIINENQVPTVFAKALSWAKLTGSYNQVEMCSGELTNEL